MLFIFILTNTSWDTSHPREKAQERHPSWLPFWLEDLLALILGYSLIPLIMWKLWLSPNVLRSLDIEMHGIVQKSNIIMRATVLSSKGSESLFCDLSLWTVSPFSPSSLWWEGWGGKNNDFSTLCFDKLCFYYFLLRLSFVLSFTNMLLLFSIFQINLIKLPAYLSGNIFYIF